MNAPFVVLIILDGWGLAPDAPGNAITSSNVRNFKTFMSAYPHTTLSASGESVGLPRGEAGNTETGHLNLGAGSIIYQDLVRINMSIADGSFFKNEGFLQAIRHAKENNSNLHLMGLVGSGGVHSSLDHLFSLVKLAKDKAFDRVFLHLFTDGRDSPPNTAISYLTQIQTFLEKEGVGKIASIMGRYWAMDRDLRWERTEKAYRALTLGEARLVEDFKTLVEASYEKGVTDEFIEPAVMALVEKPLALIKENDAVIFFNFRIDRPRQLTRAFVFEDFERENQAIFDFDPYAVKYSHSHLQTTQTRGGFARGPKIKNLFFVTMTQYEKATQAYVQVAFPPYVVNQPLGAVISNAGLRQVRLAESEKERFITFYFNGQRELPFSGEQKKITPSQKVATYDLKPEMSALDITRELLELLGTTNVNKYSLFVLNFANADMVGHTGNLEAAKKACEAVDTCLGQIVQRVESIGGAVIITADHGNAEKMLTSAGEVNTEHSASPVPFIVISREYLGQSQTLPTGVLGDVAPTILKLLGLPQPSEMTGRSLI